MRGSMESHPRTVAERAMKVQEVILRAMAKKIKGSLASATGRCGGGGAVRRAWLRRPDRSAAGPAQRKADTGGIGRAGSRALPGEVFRPERAVFPREVGRRARDRSELHLSEAGVARRRPGGQGAQAGCAPQAARTAAFTRHAVAHRWQPAPVVSG
jgi:hypothetical protein